MSKQHQGISRIMAWHHLSSWAWFHKWSGLWFNMKMMAYQYRKSLCGDNMILWLSYPHNGISCTGKTSLYWIRAQILTIGDFITSTIISGIPTPGHQQHPCNTALDHGHTKPHIPHGQVSGQTPANAEIKPHPLHASVKAWGQALLK